MTTAEFHILLALSTGVRHGLGIAQAVDETTDGEVTLGPGTLYRSIKQLLVRGLIVEHDGGSGSGADPGNRRRAYGLTPEGRTRMTEEAQRLRDLEKENSELKKLLADQLLKTKALEIALEKNI